MESMMADFYEEFSAVQLKPKPKMPNQKEFLSSYCKQIFSLPSSIIYYIAKNPSTPEIYHKMIQCCKYFFLRNPILTFDSFHLEREKHRQIFSSNFFAKVWVIYEFAILSKLDQLSFSTIISKIYKFSAEWLFLSNNSLSFDEFLFFSSSATFIDLRNVSIKYNNGKEVEIEKLVQICPNVKTFQYKFSSNPSNISSKTVKNLLKIHHFSTMKKICFSNIPEMFNIKTLIEFLKKTDLRMVLKFSDSLSQDYEMFLNEIVEEILTKNLFVYGPPPYLKIPGLNGEIQRALNKKASF